MERSEFRRFTADAQFWAERHPNVIGLVATGSGADVTHSPDEWSDHDLWVITNVGAAEGLRRDVRWLPEADRIVLTYRETEHGVGVIFDDGHLVEVAVFGVDELAAARVNDYRVLVGGEEVEARIRALGVDRATASAENELGRFLAQILIGLNRYGRGERLSAHAVVRGRALETLLGVVTATVDPESHVPLDDLDRHRRFESAFPTLAAEIEAALHAPIPACATALIDIAERHVAPRLRDWPAAGVAAVRRVIARAESA